ncbi:MAG: 16S rRNA (cytosine(1402)-N(4))-methyltransferase [Robiginitomaculum sp.]|nr:MAG: 16S rRNA (cytosine(1402)-N(4))-methyltransferase [Robiginitomaculum sp.]
MSHIPVLINEVLNALSPTDAQTYLDGTFGAGGYTKSILKAANCNVIALDRDPNVLPHVEKMRADFPERFKFVQTEFSNMEDAVSGQKIDGVVLDIGVSSMQLDQGERGFSFMREGPLDMRMSGAGPSAADVVNHLEHSALIEIFKVYGEERRARRCADFIVRARDIAPIITTNALAGILSSALGSGGKKHPATRVFQALRIYINDELGELYRALLAAERILAPDGRLVVVTFHSLEDRIVKSFFRTRAGEIVGGSRHLPPQEVNTTPPSFHLRKRSGVAAGKTEQSENPRSRSARLRSGLRTHARSWPLDDRQGEGIFLKNVPSLEMLERMCA